MFGRVNMLLTEMRAINQDLGRHCLAVAHLLRDVVNAAHVEASTWEMETAGLLHDYGKILWPPEFFVKSTEDISLYD